MSNTYRLNMIADIKNLPETLDFLEKSLQDNTISKNDINAILLAAGEALTNIILHAYNNTGKGEIKISCRISTSQCILTIIDHGAQFDPQKVPAPEVTGSIDKRKIGGLGMFLINHFIDDVTYSFHKDYNQLEMVKKVKRKIS